MADHAWKQFERRCCRDFGEQRIPVNGEYHGPDGVTAMFAFQFKLRRALPTWLFAWLTGIVNAGKRRGKIGVLVLKTPGMEDRDALVLLRWSDWVDLHGPEPFDQQTHRADVRDAAKVRRRDKRLSAADTLPLLPVRWP